ncbi:MAG: FAD-dependent oxidoreductase [Oscillospiraceae bacterium]|nr:FAD-dependent oxidoreductase [Oscillospiraceae bacterium]
MNWHEYVNKTGTVPKWPYEVNYGKENVVETDVLVIGGGVAGCRAAIAAKQKGATVALMDRGFLKRSGSGGAGVDHWHGAVRNPCSKVTPEMYSEAAMDTTDGYTYGLARYIVGMEGWDTLLEAEQMGVQIRDEDDEFEGSIFRDEETKLLFAYDIENKHCLRVYGYNIKPAVANEARRIGVQVFDRTCVTSLLTEGGKQGARVIGATGINDRTGEFFIFKAKATVITTGGVGRVGAFAPELTTSQAMADLNQAGLGHTIGWLAGAEFIRMESFGRAGLSGMGYAPYSTGNDNNTYQGVNTVDKDGNKIHYAYADGRLIYEEEDIFKPIQDDSFIIGHGIALDNGYKQKYRITHTEPELWDKVMAGELQQPFYTDMTTLSEKSRRLIFGLMLAHEGKCRVPIYKNLTDWGFDPALDMLQYPIATYEAPMLLGGSWPGAQHTPPNWRGGGGGYLVDWRLMTSLPGLFAGGGGPLPGSGCHGESHTTGRYAGRQAAVFAAKHDSIEPDAGQIADIKAKIYAPVNNPDGDIGWKEFNYAVARIMQDYCGEYKTLHTLDMGIRRMRDLMETEGERMYASNPHELARAFESLSLAELGIAYMEVAKTRTGNVPLLGFNRTDLTENDDSGNWNPAHLENGKVVSRFLSVNYHLQEPYAPTLKENYERYAEL